MRSCCAREPRISLSSVNFLHCHLVDAVSQRPRFTAQRYASALIADDAGLSVSVCLSVTSHCCIKTSGRIELFLAAYGVLPALRFASQGC